MNKQNKNKIFRSFHSPDGMVSAKRSDGARTDSEIAAGRLSARGKACFCFVFLVTIFFLSFFTAAAQFTIPATQLPNLDLKPSLSLTLSSQTPFPNSTVTATANISGTANANNSNYSWFLNNIKQKDASGLNKNTFTFQVGGSGAVYKVGVSVSMPNGDYLSDSISLTVSDLDLTWNASSQTPASYKGKSLPTQNSVVNVSAMPFIYRPGTKTFINSDNLIFNWKLDDKFSTDNSGIGKSDFTFRIGDFSAGNKSVQLEIKTSDNVVSVIKIAEIPVVRPQTFIYFADPETGLPFGAALKNLISISPDFNFAAQNYFFNAPSKDLEWQWFINNEKTTDKSGKPWLASLSVPNVSRPFLTQIQAVVKNPANDLETTQSTLNLEIR